MGAVNASQLRKSGIALLGDVPWGTHLCQFYHSKEDLLEILVPYFKAGLENNEFCMWVTSEPLTVKDAVAAMKAAVPGFYSYVKNGQIEIIPHTDWYLKGGYFEEKRVLAGWVGKLNKALKNGYGGLRLTGNTFWIEKKDWKSFADYEATVDSVIGQYKIVAVCTYSIDKCEASEVIDVMNCHQSAIIRRAGKWEVIESASRRRAEKASELIEQKYGSLLDNALIAVFRTSLKGEIILANGAFAKIFGFKSAQEAAGQSIIPLWANPEKRKDYLAQLKEKGRVFGYEFEGITKKGKKITLLGSIVLEGDVLSCIAFDITERRKTEEALEKSEERYKLAEHATGIGSWDWNIITGVLQWSEMIEPMFGFAEGEFEATYEAFLKLVHPDDRQRVVDAVNACVEKGDDYQIEHRIVWPDSSVHWVLETGNVIRDVNGKAVRMLGIVQDITGRQQAEALLKQEKEFSENVLRTMPDGLDIVDESLRLVYMNKALEDVFGKGNVGKKCYEVYKDDKKQCENCPLKNPLGGGTQVLEVSGISGNKTFQISHTGIVLGGKRHVLEIFNDITGRKKAEEKLHIQSSALAAAANAIVLTNTDGVIEWVNPAFTELTGYSADEAVGQNPRMLKSGKQGSSFYKNLWDTVLAGNVWKGETVNRRKDGSLYPEDMTITPVRSETGKVTHFIAIKEDITARKQFEEEVMQLNNDLKNRAAELEAANKELEAFSYSTSHDLRSPLRSIDGFSQALLEDYTDRLDDKGKDFLKRLRAATQRMGQLIDDMLKLSRVTKAGLSRNEVDLSALARSVAAKLQEAEPDRDAEFVVARGIVARCDKQLVQQVFENLLGNAWKFTSRQPSARMEFGTTVKDGQQAYFIRDNGAGFDMAYAGKLFMPFQRLHSATEFPGTGIGLAIVSRVIARHGGKVWAEGSVGKGATFYFTL
ncbi:PAS domain S-box protein [Candidatus Woesearchaeota archaeon]|nr:PAS domain S-box protein [Candidatus Woesearchaeota archaeon]